MKKLYKREGKISAEYLEDNHSHLYRQGVWLFGDWDSALRAAGFSPEKMRKWASWDKDKRIREIHGPRKKNLPLYAKYVIETPAQTVFRGSTPMRVLGEGSAYCRCRDSKVRALGWWPPRHLKQTPGGIQEAMLLSRSNYAQFITLEVKAIVARQER